MDESPEEALRREELLRMYNSLRDALKVISDVNLNTYSTPTPPPLKEDPLMAGLDLADDLCAALYPQHSASSPLTSALHHSYIRLQLEQNANAPRRSGARRAAAAVAAAASGALGAVQGAHRRGADAAWRPTVRAATCTVYSSARVAYNTME